MVSVLLVAYLRDLGFRPIEIGAVVTATLVGSAALTLAVGLNSRRFPARTVLVAASLLMLATGAGFATATRFWPIVLIAAVGTLNPSAGDVSVFLPTEQSVLAGEVDPADRPQLYAIYNLCGSFAGAVGALVSAAPSLIDDRFGLPTRSSQRLGFVLYALVALTVGVVYRRAPGLDEAGPATPEMGSPRRARPRRIVFELAALFSLDSAGSGFVVQSLLVLWLHLRFELSATATGGVFFAAGVLGATSQLACGPLARRIGLIPTMVFTHLPANVLLVAAAFAPTAPLAIGLLLVRALLSQMDVPARQAFVMAVVPPEERAAAASVTNVPRSLASAATPLLAGLLLSGSWIGAPLVIAGSMKIAYDLLLLGLYRAVPAEVSGKRDTMPPLT